MAGGAFMSRDNVISITTRQALRSDESMLRARRECNLAELRANGVTAIDRKPFPSEFYTTESFPVEGLPEAKACPFCGEIEPQIVLDENDDPGDKAGLYAKHAHIQCDGCLAETGGCSASTYAEALRDAVALWNRRPLEN